MTIEILDLVIALSGLAAIWNVVALPVIPENPGPDNGSFVWMNRYEEWKLVVRRRASNIERFRLACGVFTLGVVAMLLLR